MKKFAPLVLILLVLTGLFIYFSIPVKNSLTSSQKESLLEKTVGRDVSFSSFKNKENKTFEGKKVSFKYPGDAILYNYKDPNFATRSGSVEMFSYDLKEPRVVFNYVATDKNLLSLSDDPAVALRRTKARGYSEELLELGQEGAKFTRKGTENEVSLFILRNGVVYSFVLTGSDFGLLNIIMGGVSSSLVFK